MTNLTTQSIVVPWDFSDMSKDALKRSVELAESRDQIEVIHVTPYPSAVDPSVVWGAYDEDKIADNLHQSFQREVDEDFRDLKFTAMFGDPGGQIGKFAKEKDAGLIVISSHGRKGVTRMLLGSVAERVVRLAPCPVLVLRQ